MPRMKRIYAETSQHVTGVGAYYGTGHGATADDAFSQYEVIVRAEGKPGDGELFKPDEWALVLRGISRAKAEAIVMILNAPEPNE